MQEKKICLVIGAGAGIGVNVAKKFAVSGYHSVISRRTNQFTHKMFAVYFFCLATI